MQAVAGAAIAEQRSWISRTNACLRLTCTLLPASTRRPQAFQRRYSPDGASPLTAAELEGVPPGDRYVAGLYFTVVTVATLGYGE